MSGLEVSGMGFFEEFARRFYLEAVKDLERAKRAFNESDFPDCVFHCQQCVEKAVKAMVETKREYVRNHGPVLASVFSRVFEGDWREEFEFVVDVLGWFLEYYTRSRYPFAMGGRIVSPGEFIDEETAKEALEKAERVLKIAGNFLKERGVL